MLIPARRARRRNDLELTTARRRNLHLPVNARRWAYDPFDWASLSFSGSELPPPTVGGSPLTSGGHVAPVSGGGFVLGCASATFAAATATNTEMTGTTKRNGQVLADFAQPALINVLKPLSVPRYLPGKERAYTSQRGCKAIAATWEEARVFAIEAE